MHRTDRRTFLAGVAATAGLPLFGRRAFAEDALIAAYIAITRALALAISARDNGSRSACAISRSVSPRAAASAIAMAVPIE